VHAAITGGSVYLVIDCSASMSGEGIAEAKTGALNFAIQAQGMKYAVGLIAFSDEARHIAPLTADVIALPRQLGVLTADGSTAMEQGIGLATAKLAGRTRPAAMVVVTDGEPNDADAALAAAQVARQQGIDIIALGTGDADVEFLKRLASRDSLAVIVNAHQLAAGIAGAANMLPRGGWPPPAA
jgi:Mg-chelatase subunit ChlD